MTASPTNPFVLPGFGQTGDSATNPLLASMEMMRQAFAGLGGPAGMTGGIPLSPPMNLDELERKIAELRSVENWLKLNLSMLSSTIQGMEVQLATVATLKSFMAASSNTAASEPPAPSWPGAWPSGFPMGVGGATGATASAGADKVNPAPQAQPAAAADVQAAATTPPAAAQAWWNMLQQQFGQVAAATAASMAPKTTATAHKSPTAAAKKASSKGAAKRTAKVAPKKPLN